MCYVPDGRFLIPTSTQDTYKDHQENLKESLEDSEEIYSHDPQLFRSPSVIGEFARLGLHRGFS